MDKEVKIVCLGGGIGTANLIKGLKRYYKDITVVVSMADSGGSSGRLRRLYKIHPVGDLVSCMAALSQDEMLSNLLMYRFPGERFNKTDSMLSGHKLGNLLVVGAIKSTGNFEKAINFIQHTFNIKGSFLPATKSKVSISAKTVDGNKIYGEDKITRGKYKGRKIIDRVFLKPKNAIAFNKVVKKIREADLILAGPGDLYSNLLPVLLVPSIPSAINKSKALKVYITNVANKPFETKNYSIDDYIAAIKKHIKYFPFKKIVANNNLNVEMPKKFRYKLLEPKSYSKETQILKSDLIDRKFPLYHDSDKLAKAIVKLI